ncbi:fimbrial biogenesis chaperone [Cetobacterium somerae]
MKKITMIITIFILIVSNIFCFDINTTLFDKRVDNGDGYKEIVFKNKYPESVRYKVKVIKSDDNKKDMSSWVEISPAVLNIGPLSERVLKIFAKSPNGTKEGEYSFKLQIEPIVIPTISKVKEAGVKGNSSISFVPIIEMFGYVGNPNFEKNINLENANLKKSEKEYILTGTLVNNAYAGKNIGFSFIGDNNFIVSGKWIGRVKPNFREEVNIKVKDNFREILIYDADTNKEIRRVPIIKRP